MANRYWVGGSGAWNNSNTTNWSTSSGGSGGASIPGSTDTAIFDASSGGGTVTVESSQPNVGGFNSTGFTGSFVSSSVDLKGTVTLGAAMAMYVAPSNSATITTNGNSIRSSYFYGTVTLTDAVTASSVSLGPQSQITLKASTTNTMPIVDWPDYSGSALINSDLPGTRATITDNEGTNYVDYITVTDIAFAGSATWYWGTGYTNGGNNTGITTPPAPPMNDVVPALFGVVA